LAAAVACPLLALWLLDGSWLAIILCLLLAAVVIWAHRANIKRLLARSENRLDAKKSDVRPKRPRDEVKR
jgi:glycerol-3-phosphate acyltransferase PlsY